MTLGAEYNSCDVETMLAAVLAACKVTDPNRAQWLKDNPSWLDENPQNSDEALLEVAQRM